MGIQGLLPILKPIHRSQHLSEFNGRTIAVDAYVWLHRGIYTCSTELANALTSSNLSDSTTVVRTTKYVEFCLARVRLLRHYGINLIIVFDGGKLEAKKGTEIERENKRKENFEKAQILEKTGRKKEAREIFAKCVDVSPQMAFQFIKALKSMNVPYIVAPYEADAQLSFLTSNGLADAILTEDSDLLVFPSPLVLFKLDVVSSTVISISRSDFASSAQSSHSLSLTGWSDKEFRWMAMLSGCDYLPSIPGIGLKTSHTLLRKHKDVKGVLRAIRMEGKKTIPKGYLESFLLAEKAFLFQRVYDPRVEKLVYLCGDDKVKEGDLDERADEYIGRNIPPTLAKQVALGDVCPVTLAPMVDINPSYQPQSLAPKPLSFAQNDDGPLKPINQNTPLTNNAKRAKESRSVMKEKEKEKAITATGGGIMSFFRPTPKSDSKSKLITTPTPPNNTIKTAQSAKRVIAGRESGKRTLVDVMEDDIAIKRQKVEGKIKEKKRGKEKEAVNTSRFFDSATNDCNENLIDLTALNSSQPKQESSSPTPRSNVAVVNSPLTKLRALECDFDEDGGGVEQEEGYISPLPSPCTSPTSKLLDTPNFSSPEKMRGQWTRREMLAGDEGKDEDDLEAISSPVMSRQKRVQGGLLIRPIVNERLSMGSSSKIKNNKVAGTSESANDGVILVLDSPDATPTKSSTVKKGPDLSRNFDDDMSSEIECWEADEGVGVDDVQSIVEAANATQQELSIRDAFCNPDSPHINFAIDLDSCVDDETRILEAQTAARRRVAEGWKRRFNFRHNTAFNSSTNSSTSSSFSFTPQPSRDKKVGAKKGRKSEPYPSASRFSRGLQNATWKATKNTALVSLEVDNDFGFEASAKEILPSVKNRLDALRYST